MILAYHSIFTTYGTWLPNDPRGSYSEEIYNEELLALGGIRYGRQNPQPDRVALMRFWTATAPRLSRAPFFINESARPVVAAGFKDAVERLCIKVAACAIMNDHVHLVVMRSQYRIEYIVNQLKGAATRSLKMKKTPWSRGCWKVFINDWEVVLAAIRYVEVNSRWAGIGEQCWDFVSRPSV